MNTPQLADPPHGRPMVSVIMANYNGAAHLVDAIESVQKQSLHNIEIIVSDDGSTDNSIDIVTQLQEMDPRIHLLRSEINGGPATARNRGFALAKGKWIAIVDSDDLIHHGALPLWLNLGKTTMSTS